MSPVIRELKTPLLHIEDARDHAVERVFVATNLAV
jgi:hypothetical protein